MDSGLFPSGKRPPSTKSDDCPQASSFTGQATSEIDREVDWIESLKINYYGVILLFIYSFYSQKLVSKFLILNRINKTQHTYFLF